MVICVPLALQHNERRAIQSLQKLLRPRRVFLIEEAAAALGADASGYRPSGSMVVDIGGGTTEVAVLVSVVLSAHPISGACGGR